MASTEVLVFLPNDKISTSHQFGLASDNCCANAKKKNYTPKMNLFYLPQTEWALYM